MSLEHFVGTATVISSLAGRFVGYPAQIRLIVKTRMVGNLSVALHGIGFVSCLLWTWHGWLNRDWVILLTQGMAGIAATGSMLFLIWRYRPRRVAGEHLMSVLVQLAALDGEVHPSERREVEQFALEWQLTVDWSSAPLSHDASQMQAAAMVHLQQYLAHRPPVAQMRELKDLIWLLAEADGRVVSEERELATALQQKLEQALRPFGDVPSTPYRVVVQPKLDQHGVAAAMTHPGFELRQVAGQGLWVATMSLTEAMARQYAAELRLQQDLAFAVPESDVLATALTEQSL